MSPIFAYLVLGLLFIITIGFWVWFFLVYSALIACETGESDYCPLMYCNDPTTACGHYPWRPDPATGAPICSRYLLSMSAPTAAPKVVA